MIGYEYDFKGANGFTMISYNKTVNWLVDNQFNGEFTIKNINDILTDKTIDLNIKIHYKNTDLVGNENKPNKTNIDLHQLDYLLVDILL